MEEGALADLLLVNGTRWPTSTLVADPGRNFTVVMKDGRAVKSTLPR